MLGKKEEPTPTQSLIPKRLQGIVAVTVAATDSSPRSVYGGIRAGNARNGFASRAWYDYILLGLFYLLALGLKFKGL